MWMFRPEVWILGVLASLLWCVSLFAGRPHKSPKALRALAASVPVQVVGAWALRRGRWSLLLCLPLVLALQQVGLLVLGAWWVFSAVRLWWKGGRAWTQLGWGAGLIGVSALFNLI